MFSSIVLVGYAGRAPDISAQVQSVYVLAQTGYVGFQITNLWWTRNITVYAIYVQIGQGVLIQLLNQSIQVTGLHGVARILPLVIPYNSPTGMQNFVVTVYYEQSTFLSFGAELQQYTPFVGAVSIQP